MHVKCDLYLLPMVCLSAIHSHRSYEVEIDLVRIKVLEGKRSELLLAVLRSRDARSGIRFGAKLPRINIDRTSVAQIRSRDRCK